MHWVYFNGAPLPAASPEKYYFIALIIGLLNFTIYLSTVIEVENMV